MSRKCKSCGHDISEYASGATLCAICEASEAAVSPSGVPVKNYQPPLGRPVCSVDLNDDSCNSPEDHEGWRHALSFGEVQSALFNEQLVFDCDGDRVLELESLDEPVSYYYAHGLGDNEDEAQGLNTNVSWPGFFLVEGDLVPVSDEEVAKLFGLKPPIATDSD